MLLKGIVAVSAVAAVLICIFGGVAFWWLPALFVGAFLVLTLAAFGFLCLVCAFVDMDKPQEHDSPFYRRVTQVYIDALVSLLRVRIHTTGLEKVPTEGRFVLVCNHLFIADPCVLLHCFPKSQLAFVTKQENQKLFVVGKVMHKILCQPIDRENDRAALKTIIKCIQLLKDWGYEVIEGKLAIADIMQAARDGKLEEVFGTGTAAVVSPVKELVWKGEHAFIGDGKIGPVTQKLYDTMTGMQWGKIPDTKGWIVPVEKKN